MKQLITLSYKQPRYLITSLALNDLAIGLLITPFGTIPALLHCWPYGEIFCQIQVSLVPGSTCLVTNLKFMFSFRLFYEALWRSRAPSFSYAWLSIAIRARSIQWNIINTRVRRWARNERKLKNFQVCEVDDSHHSPLLAKDTFMHWKTLWMIYFSLPGLCGNFKFDLDPLPDVLWLACSAKGWDWI